MIYKKISYNIKNIIIIFQNSMRFILKWFFIWTLLIRSYFLTETSFKVMLYMIIPLLNATFFILVQYYPESFSHFQCFYVTMVFGSQLIFYDGLGSMISDYVLNKPDPILSIAYLTSLSQHRNFIKRYVGTQSVSALILGKTAMTSTGRATLFVGILSAGTWLYNNHQDRKAADIRADADRKATDIRADADRKAADDLQAKTRAYQNYQDARRDYLATPFYKKKGDKPTWNENRWKDWSKT